MSITIAIPQIIRRFPLSRPSILPHLSPALPLPITLGNLYLSGYITMPSCVVYFTPWDTFVVRREKLASGVYASCDPVLRLSPNPWPLTLGLAAWRVLHARPRVARGTISKLGMSLRRFAQAVDHAKRVEVSVKSGTATVVPCSRNLAGLFNPISDRATTSPSSPLSLGRAILLVSSAQATASSAPESRPEPPPVSIPSDASLILARGATPEDLVDSLGITISPRRSRKVSRPQRDFARRLTLAHHDGWLIATPVESVDAGDESLIPLLEHLSRHGTAIYLAAHDPARYYAWALASEGRLERAFGTDASSGEILVNLGPRWNFEPPTDDTTSLTGQSVRDMAREWAFDPWTTPFTRLSPENNYKPAAA